MKRTAVLLIAMAMMTIMAAPATSAEATITFENPPPGGVLELAIGESHTFDMVSPRRRSS